VDGSFLWLLTSVFQCVLFFITKVTILCIFMIMMIPLPIEFVRSPRQNQLLSVGKFVTEHNRIMTTEGFRRDYCNTTNCHYRSAFKVVIFK